MDKKLTLSLNASVVESAKIYAKDHGVSLSRMIENYLSSLISGTDKRERKPPVSPLVSRLIGVIDLTEAHTDDLDTDYTDYLTEKYR